MKLIESSYNSNNNTTHVELITEVVDINCWQRHINLEQLKGISTPHIFSIYKRKNIQNSPIHETIIYETILSTKFLSTTDEDSATNPPIVLFSGPAPLLPDPTPIPKSPLNYSALEQMVDSYTKAGEFTIEDANEWKTFLNNHRESIGTQCNECNTIQKQIVSIGPIHRADPGDTKQKEIEKLKTKEKNDLKKKLQQHLNEVSHPPSTGWWTDALPLAGSDVPYNNHSDQKEVEELNRKFNERYQSSNSNHLSEEVENLALYKLQDDGKLIEPTGQLVYRGTKASNIVEELENNVSVL
jgi:hypothetical protein